MVIITGLMHLILSFFFLSVSVYIEIFFFNLYTRTHTQENYVKS